MFYRLSPDGARRDVDLGDACAGPGRTPCWIIGGGPSLADLPAAEVAASPAAKFAVNLAGHGVLRPDFWTSYDPTARFLKSIYLDASITKFVHRARAMDLAPGTTFKVCECPATLFFDRQPQRGYHDFPAGGSGWSRPGGGAASDSPAQVTDWQDSLIQAIDIAWRLGFRTLYLVGCEMLVRPSAALVEAARRAGVEYRDREPLQDFMNRCRRAGCAPEELEAAGTAGQYHFDEVKPLAAAVQTDLHYFRVAQYLRLSRRAMSLAGLELISVTAGSRLNDYFRHLTVAEALAEVRRAVGDPATESTRGKYTSQSPPPDDLAPMRDLPPHNWPRDKRPAAAALAEKDQQRRTRLRAALAELPEIAVPAGD
jgi:hypothetical protein